MGQTAGIAAGSWIVLEINKQLTVHAGTGIFEFQASVDSASHAGGQIEFINSRFDLLQ
jgi:hypothetical protein